MSTPTASLRHDIQPVDTRLIRYLACVPEQQALRVLIATLLGLYGWWLDGGLWLTSWGAVLLPASYALLQAVLTQVELRRGEHPALSLLVTLLDAALLAPMLFNDPVPATPTLMLVALMALLAGLRWSPRGRLGTTLLLALLATVTLATRNWLADEMNGPFLIVQIATLLLLLAAAAIASRQTTLLQRRNLWLPGADPDTGLGNRATLYAAADLLFPLVHRQQLPLTLLYVVIEPQTARARLAPAQVRQLAAGFADCARGRLRGSDLLVRYGELEFVFLLPDCPNSAADPIAHELQARMQTWCQAEGLAARLHVGATWLPTQPMALDQLLISMDEALARARQSGWNRAGAIHADPEQARLGPQLS